MKPNPRFNPNQCARCGEFKLERPDGLPFCAKCEKRLKERFSEIRPDLAGKMKVELFHDGLSEQE